ncbi:MAG: PQQ-like beta-propeller repeat protein [Lentisphaerae bacterium]|nr:PQQ-like beta-propeller repeat protein [Lentisphaerota bacterium]
MFKTIVFFILMFSIPAAVLANPDIKANGSNGPLTIATNAALSIEVSLDGVDQSGVNADWWVAADTPLGWYHYAAGNSWLAGISVSYQGPLFNFSSFEILYITGLPLGAYTLYFGVDLITNGSLDTDQLFYDSVVVNVTETNGAETNVTVTSVIPWPMFHYNAQHTGQSPYNGPTTNTLKWSYTSNDITVGTVPGSLAISSNTIYVTAANKLLALNRTDGALKWSANLAGTGATAISPDGSNIYAVGGSKLYAFTTSGAPLWVYEGAADSIHGEPCIGTNGTIYFGSWDTYVYALNPDGTLKWKYQTDGAIAPLASPALSPDEATVYVGSGDPNKDNGGSLYALNADGTLKWQKANMDQMRVSGAVVGTNGRVYANGQGRVHCFSPEGTQIWESANNTAGSLAPSLSSNGTIYVGTAQDGKVYALDSANGQTQWSYQTGTNSDQSEPQYGVLATIVIGANGIVYAGAYDGVMHALRSDGTLLWTYQTGDNINENCPAIDSDGTLYFSSADKYIYAINE